MYLFISHPANGSVEKSQKKLKELLWGGNFSTHKTDEAQNDILTNCHLTDELISPVWIRTTAHKLIGMNLYH